MRVPPQVSDRIKEAPAQMMRGVFAGIGQLLLITDKLRNKTPASQQVRPARAAEPSQTHTEPVPPVQPAPSAAPVRTAAVAGQAAEARDFDKTGNVRLLTTEEAGADHTVLAAEAATAASQVAAKAEVAAAAEDAAGATHAEPDAPLPNYDELSVASLRARLRNLDLAQVRQLAEYEKAHAARADVMTMFERRIAKLEAETNADEQAEAEAQAAAEAQAEVAAETEAEVAAEAEDEA